MSDLAQELFFPNFRGIPFLMDSHSMEYGRKVAVHEYPNKKYVYVEDLGQKLRTFTVDAIITGDNYIIRRDAFILALNVAGPGLLTHPFFGVISVVVTNYTLSEAPRELGIARFSIQFQEANTNIFPIASPSNSATINDIVNSLQSYLAGALITTFTTSFNHNISYNASKCSTISTTSSANITTSRTIDQNALNEFTEANDQFLKDRFSLVQNPSDLANSLYNLLSLYNNISTDSIDQYNLNANLFYFGQNDSFPNVETGEMIERKNDFLAFNSQVNAILLANMYGNATLMTFLDDVQLNSIADDLEAKYQYLSANNNLDEDTLIQLEDIRIQMLNYFNTILTNVSKVFSTTLDYAIPLTVLLYGYYENFDFEDEVIALNNIFTPSLITGDIQLLSTQVL